MKFLSNAFFTIAIIIFFSSLTLSFVVIQIIINKHLIIDEKNVNLFDLLLKSSFTLIGSSLSGFVAFLIFFLGDRKSKKDKIETNTKLLSKISDEADNNLKIFNEILNIFADTPVDQLAELIHKEKSKVKEALLIYYTKLDFSIFQSTIADLNEKSYAENIQYWRKQKAIYDFLELLLTKIEHKENSIMLLQQIKSEIQHLIKSKN